MTVIAAVMCRGDQFQCPSDGPLGQCHAHYYVCDGYEDCDDGYDEENCTIGEDNAVEFQNICKDMSLPCIISVYA